MLFLTAAQQSKCPSDKFDCYKNGSLCIEATKLCDSRKDCANFADEDNELCACKNLLSCILPGRYLYLSSTNFHTSFVKLHFSFSFSVG